ncbi:hypothetical protein OG216_36090 [Streptomycetaceae bacterium NBC_01309]
MARQRLPRFPGLLATLLAVVLLLVLGGPAAQASPAQHAPVPLAGATAPASGADAPDRSAAWDQPGAPDGPGAPDRPGVPDGPDAPDGPPVDAQAGPSGTDTADEGVRTLPVRAPLHTHGGEPYPIALPWATPPEPWHVLAAGGPPGFRPPDRAVGPLVRTAPRAERAPPAPAGI